MKRFHALSACANDLLGPDEGSSAGSVLTHLTSRDGVPHVRPEEPFLNAGTGFKEGSQVFLGQVED